MTPAPDELVLARLGGGEWVASELGVTRAAVGKRVSALRARGFVIEAEPRRGYRLSAVPDTLEPAVLAPLAAAQARWAGRPLEWFARIGSTNDVAAERA